MNGCGCGNQRFNFEPCTILLVIAILNNLNLLDPCHQASRNALTLLFLYWLCGCNNRLGSRGRRNDRCCC